MKEQSKNPPDQTNEEEIGSLLEKEFRVMIVKISKILEIKWRKFFLGPQNKRRKRKGLRKYLKRL